MSRHAAPSGLPTMPFPPGAEAAFGSMALHHETSAAIAGETAAYWRDQGNRRAETIALQTQEAHLAHLHRELGLARTALSGLTREEKGRVHLYAAQHISRPAERHQVHGSLVDWLADPAIGASDKELLNFFGWHATNLARQQESKRLSAEAGQIKARYLARQARAVREGHLSPHVLNGRETIWSTRVVPADLIRLALVGRAAEHVDGDDRITTRQGYVQTEGRSFEDDAIAAMHRLAPHEFDHLVSGAWEARWLREGLAQHITLSFEDGRFYALSPHMREESPENRTYATERELIAVLLSAGAFNIIGDVATRAHSSSGPDSTEWREFMHMLDKSWGTKDTYGRLCASITGLERQYIREYPEAPIRQIQVWVLMNVAQRLRRAGVEQSRANNPSSRWTSGAFVGNAAVPPQKNRRPNRPTEV